MTSSAFFFSKIFFGINNYPVTSSLLVLNFGSYIYAKIYGSRRAKQYFLINGTESYFQRNDFNSYVKKMMS